MLSIIHISYIQEGQAAKEKTPVEKTCNTDTNYFRADDSKKNIINMIRFSTCSVLPECRGPLACISINCHIQYLFCILHRKLLFKTYLTEE